jgi:hypothetical protein
MKFRLRFAIPAFLIALTLSSPAGALEKTAAPMTDDFDAWRSGGTSVSCLVDYYNTCNGWVWVWSGWLPNDQVGVCFTSCCPGLGADVDTSAVFFWTSAPTGYGYTGTIGVFEVDADHCPIAPALASQALLPMTGWNFVDFGSVSVSSNFAVAFQFGPGAGTPLTIPTDHPLAGPTGPVACGSCYPSTRDSRTFYWGTVGTTQLCPGSVLNDGLCDAQFLWDASMHCVISVESSSWGTIKGLYR